MARDKGAKNGLIQHLDAIESLVKFDIHKMDISDLHQLDQFVFLDYLYFFRSHYFDWFIVQNLEDYFWTVFHKNIGIIDYDVTYHIGFNNRYKEWKILKVDHILTNL